MLKKKVLLVVVLAVGLSAAAFAQSTGAGSVTISYSFSHLPRIASNQLAIWVENEQGAFVRTLFATSFAAKRAGWKMRPQTLPTWIKAANVPSLPQKDVDAISGPTPRNGRHSVSWDLRDSSGRLVPPGTYVYRLECNIFWERRVLWTGKITIGDAPQSSEADAVYSPPGAEKTGILVSQVAAEYTPGK